MALWATGRRPDPSFTAMVFEPCGRVLGPELCRTKASCRRKVRKKQKKKMKKKEKTIERKKQEARSKRQKKEGAGASCRSFSSRLQQCRRAGKVKVWSEGLELVSSRFRK